MKYGWFGQWYSRWLFWVTVADCRENLQIENRSSSSQCSRSLLHSFPTLNFICDWFGCKIWLQLIQNHARDRFKLLRTTIYSGCTAWLWSEQTPFSGTGRQLTTSSQICRFQILIFKSKQCFAQDEGCLVQNGNSMELDTVDQQLEPYRVVSLWCDLGRCSRTVVVRCGEPLFAPSSSPSLLSFPRYLPSLALSVRGCRALLLAPLAAPFLPLGPYLPLSLAPAPFLGPPPAPPPPPPPLDLEDADLFLCLFYSEINA